MNENIHGFLGSQPPLLVPEHQVYPVVEILADIRTFQSLSMQPDENETTMAVAIIMMSMFVLKIAIIFRI